MFVNISLLLLINKFFQPLHNSKCFETDRPCESKYFERYLSEMQFQPIYILKNFQGSMPPDPLDGSKKFLATLWLEFFSAGPILESFLCLCFKMSHSSAYMKHVQRPKKQDIHVLVHIIYVEF